MKKAIAWKRADNSQIWPGLSRHAFYKKRWRLIWVVLAWVCDVYAYELELSTPHQKRDQGQKNPKTFPGARWYRRHCIRFWWYLYDIADILVHHELQAGYLNIQVQPVIIKQPRFKMRAKIQATLSRPFNHERAHHSWQKTSADYPVR